MQGGELFQHLKKRKRFSEDVVQFYGAWGGVIYYGLELEGINSQKLIHFLKK